MGAPTTSHQFDKAYAAPLTVWGDWRIPGEVKDLVADAAPAPVSAPARALELGCGVGRISRYMVRQGLKVTGVDFSPIAIEKAKARAADDMEQPDFIVDDVRTLSSVTGPFDLSVDVGCFHCLDGDGQADYAAALGRLLRPGATHLMWVMNSAPSGCSMEPAEIAAIFAPMFLVSRTESRRRRLAPSRWYWLTRIGG